MTEDALERCGDRDFSPEMKDIKADIAILPVIFQ